MEVKGKAGSWYRTQCQHRGTRYHPLPRRRILRTRTDPGKGNDVPEDPLESRALEIATDYLLGEMSFRELSAKYSWAPSTIHRYVKKWLREGRFDLIDTQGTSARVVSLDERLREELCSQTMLWRARIAQIAGADAAYSEKYLSKAASEAAILAYKAGDELHKALAEVAAEQFLSRLRPNITIGLASGRGVGFTIMKLAELGEKQPSEFQGLDSIRLVSLCGGGHVGTWVTPINRDLDADQNAFVLGSIFRTPKTNLHYMGGWISLDTEQAQEEVAFPHHLELTLVGMGQLNTGHHFFHHYGDVQLGALGAPLQTIKDWQKRDPTLLFRIAEIGHRLFPVGGVEGLPQEMLDAVDQVNQRILAVPEQKLTEATEVIMVAGGAQKVHALSMLVSGRCPEAPIDITKLTLVTDAWTATEIIRTIRSMGEPDRRNRAG